MGSAHPGGDGTRADSRAYSRSCGKACCGTRMDLSIIIPEIREAAPAVAANCGGHRTVCLVLEKVDIPQPGNWDKLLGNFDMPGALLFLQSVI